jgi:hypothetical protein
MPMFPGPAIARCTPEEEAGSRTGRCILVDSVTGRWTVLTVVQRDTRIQELVPILLSICRLNPNIVVAGRFAELSAGRLGTLGIPFVRSPAHSEVGDTRNASPAVQ